MAFTWRNITKGQSIMSVQDFNDVQESADVLADNLGVSRYSWSLFPLNQGEQIRVSHLDELRSGLDYIDDENVCAAEQSNCTQNSDNVGDDANNTTYDGAIRNGQQNDDGTDNSNNSPYNNNRSDLGSDKSDRRLKENIIYL